ncbi:hypothetical protein HMI54_003475 [Coelomomyces lativittatus]|nr:hypothetical protein HMI55_001090 [Coelomomyces lativittatus]KAJ1506766.1 hypothetical protein HMI56_000449 [Coelomomyces lativittatus]KAJ1517902.1 hypothetical protein HMI54_003475 [Coelomomyces lativittatus]
MSVKKRNTTSISEDFRTGTPSKRTKPSTIGALSHSENHDIKLARLVQWEYILAHSRRLHAQETILAEQQIKQVFNIVQHKKRRRKDGFLALHWENKEKDLEIFKEVSSQLELLSSQFLRFRDSHLSFTRSLAQSLEQLEYRHSLFSNYDLFCTYLESLTTKLQQIIQQLDQEKVEEVKEKVNLLASNIQTLKELKRKEEKLSLELSFRHGLSRCMEWLANPYKPEWHLSASELLDSS